MADVIVKLRIMPTGVNVDLKQLQKSCEAAIKDFGAKLIHSVSQEPFAFGLKALVFVFIMDESKGDTEVLENKIKTFSGVQSAEVVDVRRALG